uniref:Uncharacterized protein n=1 Tax=Candidatus Kentrum sp. LFY TaxID=2126342 RepID=A0A450WRY8_9GAMM|nr:MAG: hypothetical protein BECKLFY1418C_GA0070996_10639 [Candidatus Kentron sp. LFY]
MSVDKEHTAVVIKNYKETPEYFRPKFRESIMQRKVVIGMWPTEALLAGGGGIYRVKADKNFWPKNSDPMQVMRDQSLHPDNSHIEITFHNTHQFSQDKLRKFTAYFEQGMCVEIKDK